MTFSRALLAQCLLVLSVLFAAESKFELLIHIPFATKGMYSPHMDLAKHILSTPKLASEYHITIAAKHSNALNIFKFLQDDLGKENICMQAAGQCSRTAAFDCPVTFLSLGELTYSFETLLPEKNTSLISKLLKVLDPTPELDQLIELYLLEDGKLPKPNVFITHAFFGLDVFGYLLKKKYGNDIAIFTTFAGPAMFLPQTQLNPSIPSPLLQILSAALFGEPIYQHMLNSNPILMAIAHALSWAQRPFGMGLVIARQGILPQLSSKYAHMLPIFFYDKVIRETQWIIFSTLGVQEYNLDYRPSNMHYVGTSIPKESSSKDSSSSSPAMEWVARQEQQGRTVILMTMGSQMILPPGAEEIVADAFIDIIKSNGISIIWKVAAANVEKHKTKLHQALGDKYNDNYYISSEMLPQRQILSHNSTKMFLTHCGFNGLTESLFYGKPLFGLPLAGDQYLNCITMQDKGFGKFVNPKRLNKEIVIKNILEITQQNYSKHKAAVMQAQKVLRHGKTGAEKVMALIEDYRNGINLDLIYGMEAWDDAAWMGSWVATLTWACAVLVSFWLVRASWRAFLYCCCCTRTQKAKRD